MSAMQVSNQDFSTQLVRSSAILTNSYVVGTTIKGPTGTGAHLMNQMCLLCTLTKGSLTSVEIKVEYSNDNTNWFQSTTETISGGTTTLALEERTIVCAALGAAVGFTIEKQIKYPYIRISAKGTGTVTDSALSIIADIGVA